MCGGRPSMAQAPPPPPPPPIVTPITPVTEGPAPLALSTRQAAAGGAAGGGLGDATSKTTAKTLLGG